MRDFHDFGAQAALVTGGGSGIGAEICRVLAEGGARVAVGDRDMEAAERTAAGLRAAGHEARAIALDVTSPESVRAAVEMAVASFGPLTLCANNAGIVTARLPAAEIPAADWSRQIAVNLSGVFHCLQAQLPALLEAGGGSIVNVSSICGLIAVQGTAAYSAAKHGVIGLTKATALDYATRGIRVNAIAPGYVDTPLLAERPEEELRAIAARHPMDRMASGAEIAEAVGYLLSDRASFITGTVLAADGGFTAR